MKQVFEHYGAAILTAFVFFCLGVILATALTSDGYVAVAFRDAIETFFTKLNAITPGTAPTPSP